MKTKKKIYYFVTEINIIDMKIQNSGFDNLSVWDNIYISNKVLGLVTLG